MIKFDVAISVARIGSIKAQKGRSVHGVIYLPVAEIDTVQDAVCIFPFGLIAIGSVIGDLRHPKWLCAMPIGFDLDFESCRWGL